MVMMMVNDGYIIITGWWMSHLPLWKMMELGIVGMMNFPTEWIKIMFQTTNQSTFMIYKWVIYTIQCEAPKIAKLVYKSNNYGLWYL